MVYLLATIANDADYMPAHLYALKSELAAAEAAGPEHWGVGYFADDRALIIKKPSEILSDRSAYELAPEVRSRVVVACAEEDGVRDSAPPFRFRRWLFGCAGDLSPLGAIRQRIVDHLPDFVRTELDHKGAGELAFAMFLAELYRTGRLDDPLATQQSLAQGLGTTADTIRGLVAEAQADVQAAYVATNGRSVMVTAAGIPLAYRVVEGLERLPDGPPDPTMTDFKEVATALKRFRAVVVAAHVPQGRPGWTPIAESTTLLVNRQLEVSTHEG
jgi:predicted glutamine amidotransferase